MSLIGLQVSFLEDIQLTALFIEDALPLRLSHFDGHLLSTDEWVHLFLPLVQAGIGVDSGNVTLLVKDGAEKDWVLVIVSF